MAEVGNAVGGWVGSLGKGAHRDKGAQRAVGGRCAAKREVRKPQHVPCWTGGLKMDGGARGNSLERAPSASQCRCQVPRLG
jgi:hypothetical protein